jgi:hypothetical protein
VFLTVSRVLDLRATINKLSERCTRCVVNSEADAKLDLAALAYDT